MISLGVRMLIKAELVILIFASIAAMSYLMTKGWEAALIIFLGFVLVPQPFLVFSLRDRLFRRKQ